MDDFPEPEPPPREPRADPQVQLALRAIPPLLLGSRGRPVKTTYYERQLEVLLEKNFYPWVISDALHILVADGALKSFPTSAPGVPRIVFYHHATFSSEDRLIRSRAKRAAGLVASYSRPEITKALGEHLEGLVKAELRAQRFTIEGEDTRQFRERVWTETEHDLDFVASHESGRLSIGVEVKNTLPVVEKDELDVKLRMCEHLGIRPLFAVRWNTPYIYEVHQRGGYTWTFKTWIFPPGQQTLVKRLYEGLGLPVICRTELPPGPIRRFSDWVGRTTASPST